MPDGSGVWYRDRLQEPYGPCAADDDLVLYLSKKVARREFRPLKPEELAPELFRYFDRFQVVEQCWRKVQGRWVVKDVPFTERWSDGDYRELCALLRLTLATGGRVWGAFLDGKLKGFASVEGERIGSRGQYADLSSLHVSADARGQGLGRRLFQLAEEGARRLGAGALYISAHSSVESQAFYGRWAAWRPGSTRPSTWKRNPATASWSARCEFLWNPAPEGPAGGGERKFPQEEKSAAAVCDSAFLTCYSLSLRNSRVALHRAEMPTKGVDDAGDQGPLPAAEPGHQVKPENAHQAPVDAPDHRQEQGDAV